MSSYPHIEGWRNGLIGLAIDIHRQTGPGLLAAYAACQGFEFEQAGIPLPRQAGIPVLFSGMQKLLMKVHAIRLKDGLKRCVET